MRVVLDTNVLISALLSPRGTPAEIVRRWEAGEFEVAASPALVAELKRVLTYERVQQRLRFSSDSVAAFIERFRATTVMVRPEARIEVIADDPDDNRVLECAVSSGSRYIVSGDSHLRSLQEYGGIVILAPAAFITTLAVEELK